MIATLTASGATSKKSLSVTPSNARMNRFTFLTSEPVKLLLKKSKECARSDDRHFDRERSHLKKELIGNALERAHEPVHFFDERTREIVVEKIERMRPI